MSEPANTTKTRQGYSPLFKLVIFGLLAMALIAPLGLVAMPYIEFFNDMAAQPKGKTQGIYGRLSEQEKTVERLPVDGTLARNVELYPYSGKEVEVAVQAGRELVNPVTPTMENLQEGRRMYNIYCIVCHGWWGEGDGSVIGPGRFPAPPSLLTEEVRNYPDGRIYHVISQGFGKMPGYYQQIRWADRWPVVNYVRALQRKRQMELGEIIK